jgi:hypothetical protein
VPEGDFAVARWVVWLDPERNFLPSRIKQWFVESGQAKLDREIENELTEVAAGVWAPTNSTIRVYSKDRKSATFGKLIGVNKLTVGINRSTFNKDVDPSLFDKSIPIGATVVDRIRNVTYSEGSTDPDKYLASLAKSGQNAVVLLDSKGERLTVIPPGPSRYYILAPIAGSALVLVALALFFRRRRLISTTR